MWKLDVYNCWRLRNDVKKGQWWWWWCQVGCSENNGAADSQCKIILVASLGKNLAWSIWIATYDFFFGETSSYENQPMFINLELILGSCSCDSQRPALNPPGGKNRIWSGCGNCMFGEVPVPIGCQSQRPAWQMCHEHDSTCRHQQQIHHPPDDKDLQYPTYYPTINPINMEPQPGQLWMIPAPGHQWPCGWMHLPSASWSKTRSSLAFICVNVLVNLRIFISLYIQRERSYSIKIILQITTAVYLCIYVSMSIYVQYICNYMMSHLYICRMPQNSMWN